MRRAATTALGRGRRPRAPPPSFAGLCSAGLPLAADDMRFSSMASCVRSTAFRLPTFLFCCDSHSEPR